MKIIYKISIVLVFVVLFFNCSDRKKSETSLKTYYIEKAIDNEKDIFLDEISKKITIVPLETSDDVLIDKILYMGLHKDLLYIFDNNMNCFVFDLNGKFLYKVGSKGQGPGEYVYVSNLFFFR